MQVVGNNRFVELARRIMTGFLLCGFALCSRGEDSAAQSREITTKSGVVMVELPGGWFVMGDPDGSVDEKPHKVFVSPFCIDKYKVNQDGYVRLMGENPSRWKGENNPVEQIRWSDAVRYCNARSRAEDLQPCYNLETWSCDFSANGYRLPTEAEWEYAARADTKGRYFFGNDPSKLKLYAWFSGNSGQRARPLAQKLPNPWGLFDVYGDVWEWCHDIYKVDYYSESPERDPHGPESGEARVLRGGCWNSGEEKCSSCFRYNEDPGYTDPCFGYDIYGFRTVRRSAPAKAAATTKTGFVYSTVYLEHDTGGTLPERPDRLKAVISRLETAGTLPRLTLIEPSVAPLDCILAVHTREYVDEIQRACNAGQSTLHTADVVISKKSYDVACLAAGGVLSAVDAVIQGKVRNAFCAVRPPGHHALKNKAMGFCLFNNVAIATRYVQRKYGLAKVLIVDWDVHHGNGTQDAFYDDSTVLYFSVHRSPFYPGTGGENETGTGKGLGFTVNVPLPAGSGDKEYQSALEERLIPRASAFQPDFVLISAGFDAHVNDPLGGMKVTAQGYAEMTRIVMGIAEKYCNGRLVSVLEGGYDLDGLAESANAHLAVLCSPSTLIVPSL